ncbi:MAG: hypothetical protein U0744_13215 [Gemmataceae bacterium]
MAHLSSRYRSPRHRIRLPPTADPRPREVGVGDGLGTDDLCRELRHAYPKIELLAGGGVHGLDDLHHLDPLGLDAVLVASHA